MLWLIKGLGRGGAEHLLLRGLPHVDPARFDVEIAYLLPWKDALVPAIEEAGTTVHCLQNVRPLDPRWLLRLRRLVKERDYEVIHTHMPYPAVGARLAVGRDKVIVHTEHNVWARYRFASRIANKLTIGRNAAVIAVSEAVAESVSRPQRWRRRDLPVRVVLHGVDDSRTPQADDRHEARQRLGVDDDALVVGTVGNLTAKKDHASLIAAFTVVRGEVPGAKLVLVGDGPLRAELTKLVDKSGLADDVVFAGSRDDVPRLLPGFDVFALSSRHEGLPIALLEALTAGLPCVCTSVGGVPEVVRDGTEGFLTEPGNHEALARALVKLLLDPDLRRAMARRARHRAPAFDMGAAVARIQDLYDEALAGQPVRA